MMLEILAVILLGIVAGSITGLIPGLHINLVALMLLVFSPFFLNYFSPLALAIFIIAMSITHTFVDFVPSIFLGAPDDDTALSVLPGHKFLLNGEGYGAVKLTLIGSFFALFIIFLFTPIFILVLPKIYPIMQNYMAFILIGISSFLVLREREKFWTLFLFMLSGILGIATLNLAVIKQPLFPLLSGLFGISLLGISVMKKVKIPKQKITEIEISSKENTKAFLATLISTPLCCFLPGLGSAQAAVIGSAFFRKISQKTFLILLGAINTVIIGASFVALYAIDRTRTGSAVIVDKLIENFSFNYLIIFLGVIFVSGCASYFLTLIYARFFARNITRFRYDFICMLIMSLIIIASFFISGAYSIIVLAAGTAIGILSSEKGVKRMFLMGSLMLPVILYYI